jgi:hypothetical protein
MRTTGRARTSHSTKPTESKGISPPVRQQQGKQAHHGVTRGRAGMLRPCTIDGGEPRRPRHSRRRPEAGRRRCLPPLGRSPVASRPRGNSPSKARSASIDGARAGRRAMPVPEASARVVGGEPEAEPGPEGERERGGGRTRGEANPIYFWHCGHGRMGLGGRRGARREGERAIL